ncbi:Periplasmic nitrate reductase precursor [Raoultella planticola]|uniref:Periplasmic nitrate reductase n=1 Tax=Raoultella planticola TaxID=575 RepID=A0A485AW18_RAOPL|nr:Periplasmic nitrate reductase precursor [Raoultella planticola]
MWKTSDLVVLVGSNAAWAHPVLYQRLVQAKRDNPQMKVVVIDPRRTATCDIADSHLAVAPGSDGGLFVGLLRAIAEADALTGDFRDQSQALAAAAAWDTAQGGRILRAGGGAGRRVLSRFHRRAASDNALHHGNQSVGQRQRQV